MDKKRWIAAQLNLVSIAAYVGARERRAGSKIQEPLFSYNPEIAYLYSLKVIRRRFPMGERAISKSPEWSVRYARFVLKGRFRMGERVISRNPEWACEYAIHVVKGRLPGPMHRRLMQSVGDPFVDRYVRYQNSKSDK